MATSEKKSFFTPHAYLTQTVISSAFFMVFAVSGIFSPIRAYVGCPDSPEGVLATIGKTDVTFVNTTSECRHIGIAVYRLYSETLREDVFYYSKVTGLRAADSASYNFSPPPCAYVVDAMVGEPIQIVKGKADYGSRLLSERVVGSSYGYCPASKTSPSADVPPLPSPKLKTPLPQPSQTRPQPKVLGASIVPISSSPLAVATGSDATPIITLLASVLASGTAIFIKRTCPPKFSLHRDSKRMPQKTCICL